MRAISVILAIFLSATLFGATSVSKKEYLDIVAEAVAAYDEAHILRYTEETDKNGVQEHGFPRLTSNLGLLLADGRIPEKRALFKRMMSICCRDMKRKSVGLEGNEFSVKELIAAILAVEGAGIFPKDVTDAWRREIAAVDPYISYREKPEVGEKDRSYNWCVFGCASEQMRLAAGMGGDRSFVEKYVPDQMRWFDASGMWLEPHEPIVYDLVTRLQFALILSSGYAGPGRSELEAHLDKGAEATLKMLSAAGEIPYGGRSNQFLHNETLYAALCEWYAARFRSRGDLRMAARFRMAARRAVDALWRNLSVKPVRHVKNRYPRGEGKRGSGIGCERYAYFDKYMVTMGSWAALAARFADETPLKPADEPRYGAFVSAKKFHIVCLTAGDYSAQFDYNADLRYDSDGLGRLHRRGAPTQICMSTPCAQNPSYSTEMTNSQALAFVPIAHDPLSFVDAGSTADSAWAQWRLGSLDWRCRLTEEGLFSELKGCGALAMKLPAFQFDGENETEIALRGHVLEVSYQGWTCVYETNGRIFDVGQVCCNRNGRYRVFEARGKDALEVRVTIKMKENISL